MNPLAEFRRELHRHPELSGSESATARRVVRFFESLKPDLVIEGLGGHGVAIGFAGAEGGLTLHLRCELDALPIAEASDIPHRSTVSGVSHKCGHDGHMAILAAVGAELSRRRPKRGRVVLLYQPAEENGQGAAAILRDERYSQIAPELIFAMHNLPGFPLGELLVREGAFSCASRGMRVTLRGAAAHAAQPETGVSPGSAMCEIMTALADLRSGMDPGSEIAPATVVGARLGSDGGFGISPGDAEVRATLRSEADAAMNRIAEHAEDLVRTIASGHGVAAEIEYSDDFRATVNSARAVEIVRRAAGGARVTEVQKPFRWSEDFGRFSSVADAALFGIGAGEEVPELHNERYDFPDELIPLGAAAYLGIVRECLG